MSHIYMHHKKAWHFLFCIDRSSSSLRPSQMTTSPGRRRLWCPQRCHRSRRIPPLCQRHLVRRLVGFGPHRNQLHRTGFSQKVEMEIFGDFGVFQKVARLGLNRLLETDMHWQVLQESVCVKYVNSLFDVRQFESDIGFSRAWALNTMLCSMLYNTLLLDWIERSLVHRCLLPHSI